MIAGRHGARGRAREVVLDVVGGGGDVNSSRGREVVAVAGVCDGSVGGGYIRISWF